MIASIRTLGYSFLVGALLVGLVLHYSSSFVRLGSTGAEFKDDVGRRLRIHTRSSYPDSQSGTTATADWISERVATSSLRRNWLPQFGGDSSSDPSSSDPPNEWPGDDSVPDDIASFRIVKEVPKLPYRMYDHFDLGGALGRMKDRRVIRLKNDVAEVLVDPEHGGKILSYKVRGKEQLFRNPVFQPGMLGNLGAWTSGGIEFNWPLHGHSVFTASPVFVASFQAKEVGTVLRIYEFDRTLNSTWQVDVALLGEMLAVHPRVVNTNDHPIDGYWWTNIGTKLTDSTRVLYSDSPYVLRNGGPKGDYLASFPMLSDDTHAGVLFEGNSSTFSTDHSFPRNNYLACEMFIRPQRQPDKTLWMSTAEKDGSGFVHTQPASMTGRKYWVWGQDPADLGRMRFLSRCKVKDGQPSTEDCEGSYIEMQAGPAPTQNNFFPLVTERSWTEVFLPFTGLAGTHAPGIDGYSKGLDAVGKLVSGESEALDKLDSILSSVEQLGPKELQSWEMLHSGSGFGFIHEKLVGRKLVNSLLFEKAADAEVAPWMNLVSTGNFSSSDLLSVAPSSFMVDWPFIRLLHNAKESWLKQLHLGIALKQQGQEKDGKAALLRSVALRPSMNPVALVLLGRYEEAWKQVSKSGINIDTDFMVDVAEAWVMSLLTSTGIKDGLANALAQIKTQHVESQRIRTAQIAQLLYTSTPDQTSCQQAMHLLQTGEWAVSDGSLTRLWRDAWYCLDNATSSVAKHASRLEHPPPRFLDFNGAT